MGRITTYIGEIIVVLILAGLSSCWILAPRYSKGASVVSTGTFNGYTTAAGVRHRTFSTTTEAKFQRVYSSVQAVQAANSDPLKLDVAVHEAYVLSNNSTVSRKLDTSIFQEYGTLIDAQLAAKTPDVNFRNYTSSKKGVVKGDKGDTGYDGISPDTITCSILVGTEGVAGATYDVTGRNPSVTTLGPFEAYLYEGGTLLSQQSITYEWWMPYLKTQLVYPPSETDGLQLRRQYFEPRVHDTYSSSRSNNIVSVQIRYSSLTLPFGRKVCKASLPVLITMPGTKGDKGDSTVATVTRASIFNVMSSAKSANKSNTPFQFRPFDNLTSSWLMAFRDEAGNVRSKINGHGYQIFSDMNGFALTKINQGTVALLKNDVKRLEMDNNGTFTIYRNGVPVYQIYSTGRWKGAEGYGPTASKIFPFVRPDGYRGYTSITVNPVTASNGATVSRFVPYSTYHTVGRKFGNYSSMKSINGRYLGSTETVANPAFTFEVLFKGVTDFNKIELMEQYAGSAAHSVDIQIYNYLSGAWQTLETITNQTGLMSKLYTIMTATPYISSANARLRFNHTGTGTAAHQMLIDYVSLTKDTGAGMPQGSDKSMQYNRAGSFAGAMVNYTTVITGTRSNARMILPAGVTNIDFVNQRRQVVFSIRSSGGVVIGGS